MKRSGVCVCMCMYVCVYVCVCVGVFVYVCRRVCVCLCVYVSFSLFSIMQGGGIRVWGCAGGWGSVALGLRVPPVLVDSWTCYVCVCERER